MKTFRNQDVKFALKQQSSVGFCYADSERIINRAREDLLNQPNNKDDLDTINQILESNVIYEDILKTVYEYTTGNIDLGIFFEAYTFKRWSVLGKKPITTYQEFMANMDYYAEERIHVIPVNYLDFLQNFEPVDLFFYIRDWREK